MANNCNSNRRGCGCMRMARGYWRSYPYYTGPCPDEDGRYCHNHDDDDAHGDARGECCEHRHNHCDRCDRGDRCGRHRRCRRFDHGSGLFVAWLPLAVSANGIIPLTMNNPCREPDFEVNSGLITLENEGTYLATYTVQVPADTALDTLITLNVDGASQSAAATQVTTEAGAATASFTGQAIFEAGEGATVSLRTSEAINITGTATQPMFTLTLVRLDD